MKAAVRHLTARSHEQAKGTPSSYKSIAFPFHQQPSAVYIPAECSVPLPVNVFSTVGENVRSFASQQAVVCSGVDVLASVH